MKRNTSWRTALAQILVGGLIVLALFVTRSIHAGNEPVHLATDWSHRHLIFSAPRGLAEQFRLSQNTRYVQQVMRRNAQRFGGGGGQDFFRWQRAPETQNLLHGDWSIDLGSNATVGADNYPAKYSFNVTSANCADDGNNNVLANPDFVVYNTGLPGANPAKATDTVSFGFAFATPTGTVVITNGSNKLTLTAGTDFAVTEDDSTGNRDGNATALAAAITSGGSAVGVTAIAAGTVVTITDSTAGTGGNSITLTGTITGGTAAVTFGSTNFTGGAAGQATIAAFTNLYSSCPQTDLAQPNLYWAYNTGTGAVVTSVTLSGDGTQVAFVENVTAGAAELVILKYDTYNSSLAIPTPLTAVANGSYRGCTAPCMTTISFGTAAHTDTNSSPFYDFSVGSDTMYVGDNDGQLHKFTGVFSGTPAAAGAPWPVTVATGVTLTSPVFDDGAQKIIAAGNNGVVYSVSASGSTVITSGTIANAGGVDFLGAPIVDSNIGVIYLFAGDNTTGTAADVYTLPVGFANTNTATTTVAVGTNSTTRPVYTGDFDNTYYSSAGGTGGLYACGDPGGNPTLYKITVTAGALSAPTAGPVLTNSTQTCSPVTEFFNTSANTDYLFVSTVSSGTTHYTACATGTGCMAVFNLGATDNTTFNGSLAPAGSASTAGGTSGVVVDNASSTGGASQVYFTPLANQTCTTSTGTGGCAIQAAQSNLSE